MNAGKNIDFIVKCAEELKKEEVPVDAPAPAPSESDSKTDEKIEIEVTDAAIPTKREEASSEDVKNTDEEKKADDMSARDKAMELASKAGRPTSTGIAAGAGLGSILAALGALHRMNSDGGDTSILSNPVLLGLLGAAGGYVGGNLLSDSTDGVVAKKNSRPNVSIPASIGTLGTLELGRRIAKVDQKATDKAIDTGYHKILKQLSKKKNGIDLDGPGVTPEMRDKFNDLQKKYKRMQERKGFTSNLKARGLGEPSRMGFLRQFSDSPWNPINQIKALNPFKNVEGLGKGPNLLKNQLLSALNLSGRGKLPWTSLKAAPPRLAALAALAGTGALGVNAIRRAVSED